MKQPNNNKPTHLPLHPTAANIDNIKAQFAAHVSDKIVVQGAGYNAKTEQSVPEEQLHQEAEQQKFYPFPESGNICEWVSQPTRPGVFIVCVNLEPDATKPPHPGFFATCRQPEVSQMICDGINFLFKCQREMEAAGITGEAIQPTILPPIKVDKMPPAQ